MVINNELLDELTEKAKESPRLRAALDLRTSSEDTSQRIMNALLPGTVVPIHRHPTSAETVTIVRGSVVEVLYDDDVNEIARYKLSVNDGLYGLQIPAGQWHTVIVTEPCVIFEVKDGKYEPAKPEDLKQQSCD